ncbi:MAG: hypothetical protein WKF73_16955 [Nocardioidaceae bacterium]
MARATKFRSPGLYSRGIHPRGDVVERLARLPARTWWARSGARPRAAAAVTGRAVEVQPLAQLRLRDRAALPEHPLDDVLRESAPPAASPER